MGKEQIVVALNNEPESSPSQYLGAEIAIGTLTLDKIAELKSILQNGLLFEEMGGLWGETFNGSVYLTELMDVNDEYHKNGLIFYESLYDNCSDINLYSTENWAFVPEDNEDMLPNPEFKPPVKIQIKSSEFIVLSIRTEDLYFKAKGELNSENKMVFDETNIAKFKIQTGIDEFHSIMSSFGFSGFNLLHTVYANGVELERDEDDIEEAFNIYYSSHLIFSEGKLIAWLATNNHSHHFPFDYYESKIPCISPYLMEMDPETYQLAINNLLENL